MVEDNPADPPQHSPSLSQSVGSQSVPVPVCPSPLGPSLSHSVPVSPSLSCSLKLEPGHPDIQTNFLSVLIDHFFLKWEKSKLEEKKKNILCCLESIFNRFRFLKLIKGEKFKLQMK